VIRIRFLALLILIISGFGSACIKRVTIAEVLPVNPPVSADELVNRVNSLADFQTFGAKGTIRVTNYFTGKNNQADELPGADYTIRLKRPEKILIKVEAPVVHSDVADMATDGNRFQLAVFFPKDKRQFVYGTNVNEIKRVAEGEVKDPTLIKAGGLLNMRPQHITNAYLFEPIRRETNVFREEVRQEEKETQGARKGKRVERSYYVLYVIQQNGSLELKRKFWFDRTAPGTPLLRQQVFENGGKLVSDIQYQDWFIVPDTNRSMPRRLKVDRRNDGYGVELVMQDHIFINEELSDEVFRLTNTDKLPEINLDEPRKPAPQELKKR
jgi:hypothetical protein